MNEWVSPNKGTCWATGASSVHVGKCGWRCLIAYHAPTKALTHGLAPLRALTDDAQQEHDVKGNKGSSHSFRAVANASTWTSLPLMSFTAGQIWVYFCGSIWCHYIKMDYRIRHVQTAVCSLSKKWGPWVRGSWNTWYMCWCCRS